MVFDDLAQELRDGVICPVMLGAAEKGNGIGRLLKALRHEVAGIRETASRIGIRDDGAAQACIVKTIHTPHAGKVSVARVLSGKMQDGATVTAGDKEGRVSGVFDLAGADMRKRGAALTGDVVGLGRLDAITTGDVLSSGKKWQCPGLASGSTVTGLCDGAGPERS